MDEALKKRLIGAVVLLAIAAILWPLVFDSADQIKLGEQSKIPPKPEVKRWQPVAVPEPDADKVGWPGRQAAVNDKRDSDTDKEKAAATKTQAHARAAEQSEKKKRGEPVAEKTNEAGQEQDMFRPAWVVQVASLSDRNGARQLVEKLRARNYRAYSEVIERSGKRSYRVLIGPKFDKRKAVSIKQEIDKSEKVDSLVLNFRPK